MNYIIMGTIHKYRMRYKMRQHTNYFVMGTIC